MFDNKSYTICGSCNLLSSNMLWKELQKNYKLSFSQFGDFINPLQSNNGSGLVLILFFDDLVTNPNADAVLLKKQYTPFLKMLENQATVSDRPIILLWSKNHNENIISEVKEDTAKKEFCKWFTNKLSDLKKIYKPIYLIDINEVFYSFGSNQIFCERNWYFARCRLSNKGLEILIKALSTVMNRITHSPSKVLVLDCDNTLWGGVIGEVGIEGIILGQDGIGNAFLDFQKEIVKLANEGVLIALASKNNEEDVWDVFKNHSEMQLKKDSIVTSKINWKEKTFNIEKMAHELDLGLESFVFWDDNPLERNKMKNLMPQVKTIDVPKEVIYWPKLLRANTFFTKFTITQEDKKKSIQYKSRAKFVSNLNNTNDINFYLKSLNLSPKIVSINDSNISRAEQLCLKTNQFNLSTRRHTAMHLKIFQSYNKDFIFLVRLNDEYGDHGIVALVCLKSLGNAFVFLDTFLMSCRILGRHLEAWILSEIIDRIKKHNHKYLITEFIDTKRNTIAFQFLEEYNFTQFNDKDMVKFDINSELKDIQGSLYYLDTANVEIPNLDIYKKG